MIAVSPSVIQRYVCSSMISYPRRTAIIKQCRFMLSSKSSTGCLYYSTHHRKPEGRKHYYEVIGIPENASQTQIKNAYYRLSKIYHPDVTKDPDAQERFHEIQEAYEILGSVYSRRLYDRGLVLPSQKQAAAKRRKTKDKEEEVQVDPLLRKQERSASFDFSEWYSEYYSSSIRQKKSLEHFRERENDAVRVRMQQYQKTENFYQTQRTLVPFYILIFGLLILMYNLNYEKTDKTDETKAIRKRRKKKKLEEPPQNKDIS